MTSPNLENGGKTDKYIWHQTASDVTIIFYNVKTNNIKDINIIVNTKRLIFKIKNEVYFEGEFRNLIRSDSLCWYINNDEINIEIDKIKKEEWWNSAFIGHEEIDINKIVPPQGSFSDLDPETKVTASKMLYEQELKNKVVI